MIMALKRKLKKIVNSLSIFMLVGCSYYSMAGSIPANINNVYIPLIENDTAEFEISENLTSKITQEIAIQNILKITDDSNSDSTILGVITSATDGPFTFDSNEQVDEYRFSISLKILWVDNENEKNLIEKTFTGKNKKLSQFYFLSKWSIYLAATFLVGKTIQISVVLKS